MNIRVKAIIIGSIATSIIFLINQLIFILAAGYAGVLWPDSVFWLENKELIWRIMGIMTLIVSMLIGGALVAFLTRTQLALHGLIIGLVVSCLFLLGAGDFEELNSTAAIMFVLGTACTALGAHFTPFRRS